MITASAIMGHENFAWVLLRIVPTSFLSSMKAMPRDP